MKIYVVRKSISLGYGSHVRNPNPNRIKIHEAGSILRLDSEAPNGNVWFIDSDGERGKIECGSVANLTKNGLISLQN